VKRKRTACVCIPIERSLSCLSSYVLRENHEDDDLAEKAGQLPSCNWPPADHEILIRHTYMPSGAFGLRKAARGRNLQTVCVTIVSRIMVFFRYMYML